MPFLYLIFLSILLIIVVQLGAFSIVLTKLGLSPDSALLLLISTLIGSLINIRLFTMDSSFEELPENYLIPRTLFNPIPVFKGKIIIALNVGGALIPICFSIYLILIYSVNPLHFIPAIFIVAAISYLFSRPIKGLGIGIPIFIAPVTAALTALTIAPAQSAPLAYICGTLGVLIGADLFRLKDIKHIGAPVAAIGGAGTFDGIFFTGIIAVLLA
ncbi:MAG: DUF1614 domain-containing protein [Gammaproteobacteria bacterium]|nr:DUF1614 domain-containing protein [Gammaproteobacteria bacterium]